MSIRKIQQSNIASKTLISYSTIPDIVVVGRANSSNNYGAFIVISSDYGATWEVKYVQTDPTIFTYFDSAQWAFDKLIISASIYNSSTYTQTVEFKNTTDYTTFTNISIPAGPWSTAYNLILGRGASSSTQTAVTLTENYTYPYRLVTTDGTTWTSPDSVPFAQSGSPYAQNRYFADTGNFYFPANQLNPYSNAEPIAYYNNDPAGSLSIINPSLGYVSGLNAYDYYIWGSTQLFAISDGFYGRNIAINDGTGWQLLNSPNIPTNFYAVYKFASPDRVAGTPPLVAAGQNCILYSTDAVTWSTVLDITAFPTWTDIGISDIIWTGQNFVAVGYKYRSLPAPPYFEAYALIVTSPDGINWTEATLGDTRLQQASGVTLRPKL